MKKQLFLVKRKIKDFSHIFEKKATFLQRISALNKFPKRPKKKLTNKESGFKLFFSIEFGRNERSPFLNINTCFLQKKKTKDFLIFLGLKVNKNLSAYGAYPFFNINHC